MNNDDFRRLLNDLAVCWTQRDHEKAASYFAEDVFYSDALNYTFRDRASLLEFFRDDDGLTQSCVFYDAVFDEKQQLGAAEYTYKGNYIYHGTAWIKIENGKIAGWREYQYRSGQERKDLWGN